MISILGTNFIFRLFENHISEIFNDYEGQFSAICFKRFIVFLKVVRKSKSLVSDSDYELNILN